MTVLILGGTSEARAVAAALATDAEPVVSSLAGRVQRPRLPAGEVRTGGFGGVDKLAVYLRNEEITRVVDATHPFAAQISGNAVAACLQAGVPLLRLARPGWSAHPDAGSWRWVDDHDSAARTAATLGMRVLLTTGRQPLPSFVDPLGHATVWARVVDPPQIDLPDPWTVLLDRGPYTYDGELDLMRRHRTEVLVTKDSGGSYTRAKLDAAREHGAEVVVVRRPDWRGSGRFEQVDSVGAAVDWVRSGAVT